VLFIFVSKDSCCIAQLREIFVIARCDRSLRDDVPPIDRRSDGQHY